jgi:hypothetical protein
MRFLQRDLKKVEPTEGKFVFVNAKGDQLVLVRDKEKPFNYYAF